MGREQELHEAARTGNVSVVNKILGQRSKGRSGRLPGLASLRRNAHPNCQDSNGETPLHHAALNGHKEVVKSLLEYEASANIVDNKGCYPLHLAAFNSHADVCVMLLSQGPSKAHVNQQNNVGETALHCACQYGHTEVVNILLEYWADPFIRNNQKESPFDLATKYGRLDTVRLLVRKYPGLVDNAADDCSPLHLAARHGHKQVVSVLLEAGFNINIKTDRGSALHEAIFTGKSDVVRFLLEKGIDINLTDSNLSTAVDLVNELHSQRSIEIKRIIQGFKEGKPPPYTDHESDLIRLSSSCGDQCSVGPESVSSSSRDPFGSLSSHSGIYCLGQRQSGGERSPLVSHGSRESVTSASSSVFEVHRHSNGSLLESDDPIYDCPASSRPVSIIKPSNRSSHGSDLSESSSGSPRNSSTLSVSPKPPTPLRSGETPKKPPRRKPPANAVKMVKDEECKLPAVTGGVREGRQTSGSFSKRASLPNDVTASGAQSRRRSYSGCESDQDVAMETDNMVESVLSLGDNNNDVGAVDNEQYLAPDDDLCTGDIAGSYTQSTDLKSTVPIPQLIEKTVQSVEPTLESVDQTKHSADQTQHSTDQIQHSTDQTEQSTNQAGLSTDQSQHSTDQSQHPTEQSQHSTDQPHRLSTSSSSRPPSLDLTGGSVRSSREVRLSHQEDPLTPTGYQQPPTPDHPPPSPTTALLGIHEKIIPQEKRRSRDMETITESSYLTEGSKDVEEKTPTAPDSIYRRPRKPECDSETLSNGASRFEGLMKGSIPSGQRRIKSQIYDSVLNVGSKSKKRKSALGLAASFGDFMEKEEKPPDGSTDQTRSSIMRTRSDVKDKRLSAEMRRSLVKEAANRGLREDGTDSPLVDESEEWEKISAILSSCGLRMTMANYCDSDYFEKRLQQLFDQDKDVHSVGDWLEEIGLSQFENILIAHGFDDLDFLGEDVLDDQDLLDMGITCEQHRQHLLSCAAKLPHVVTIQESPPESVEAWLASLRLSLYLDTFESCHYSNMERVKKLWDLELSTVLDISSLGHRKRILASLGSTQDRDSQGEEIEDFTRSLNWSCLEGEDIEDDHGLNLFKDYTNLKPHPPQSTQEDIDDLDLRPPQVPIENAVNQWKHRPEVLIKGCCNYAALYLGSTLVQGNPTTDSTKEALQKMKKSTENISKIPSIVLSISYSGVKFIDMKNKGGGPQHVICEHEISNILCICQDVDDLTFFAYITRDMRTDAHYCHVFCGKSTELAAEVILTLGEAFEVAYQVAMREQGGVDCGEPVGRGHPLPTLSESSPEMEGEKSTEDEKMSRASTTSC